MTTVKATVRIDRTADIEYTFTTTEQAEFDACESEDERYDLVRNALRELAETLDEWDTEDVDVDFLRFYEDAS